MFFLVARQVFHPEGVDSSLFVVIYLSMIFICLRVCFIILFTSVPLSAPHLSPSNVTHGCICSVLLCVCLSPFACPTTVILTLSSPAWRISSFTQSGFISFKTKSGKVRAPHNIAFIPAPSLLILAFSCGPLLTQQCSCGELKEVTDSIRGSYITWLCHHLITFTCHFAK